MKPILFNTDMVRALLEGQKTVTRRVVKGADQRWCFDGMEVNPAMTKVDKSGEEYPVDMPGLWAIFESEGYPEYPMIKAPCQPSDILYVRETFATLLYPDGHKRYVYKATDTYPFGEIAVAMFRWHPSIHMPKEAARLFLRVTDVRVERLQNITRPEIEKEGLAIGDILFVKAIRNFARLWDSTIKPADRALYGWTANPWCWAIEFERITKEEAYGTAKEPV